jgi:Tfp pilus assembly PilM family ATPase
LNRINLKSGAIYLEIGQSTLHALQGEEGLELPLERLPTGRLSNACKQNLALSLRSFFKREPWRPQPRAYCAISARGVSLRTITLPSTSKENLQRLLLLQIESEFPLSPDELAWGYLPLNHAGPRGNGSLGQQEYLIAAVRKEVIEEYAELLASCGLNAVFTVAAMARQELCPKTVRPQALLDIGRHQSELVSFENGVPKTIRVISWGGEAITEAIAHGLGITRIEAEDLKLKLAQGHPQQEVDEKLQRALEVALDGIAKAFNGQSLGEKIYLTGQSVRLKDLAPSLARRLGPGIACEGIEPAAAAGRSAAILALKSAAAEGKGALPFLLKGKPIAGTAGAVRRAPWKLCALAAGLACAVLVVPYLEAVMLKPFLAHKLAGLKEGKRNLALIDAEWSFFQHLKQNAPPYLDALFLLAKASPPGGRIDSLSMNRRGELSLRCSMQNSQQVTDFRSKLIDSGFFANVTVEEQTPSPDRQKLAVRMSAQWKPLSARQSLAFGPTKEEIEKAKTRVREPQMGGGPMMPMMPPPMAGPGMPGPMPEPVPSGGPPGRVRPPRAVSPGPGPPGEPLPGPPPTPNP